MKKILFLMIILLVSVSLVSAVSIQIRPCGGYGLGLGSQVAEIGGLPFNIGKDQEVGLLGDTKNENIYYNPAAGLYFGGAVLVGLNENLGIEAGFGYVMGTETEVGKYSELLYTETGKLTATYMPID